MGLSDLPDMYKGVGVHIRQIMRARDTTDMCHCGWSITQANEVNYWGYYIDNSVKFAHGLKRTIL